MSYPRMLIFGSVREIYILSRGVDLIGRTFVRIVAVGLLDPRWKQLLKGSSIVVVSK